MANLTGVNVLVLDTTGSIRTDAVNILWIMHYAALDDGEVDLLDANGGNQVFYYKNVDVSVLGNYRFFHLGGQHVTGLHLNTLTANGKVWVGTV